MGWRLSKFTCMSVNMPFQQGEFNLKPALTVNYQILATREHGEQFS